MQQTNWLYGIKEFIWRWESHRVNLLAAVHSNNDNTFSQPFLPSRCRLLCVYCCLTCVKFDDLVFRHLKPFLLVQFSSHPFFAKVPTTGKSIEHLKALHTTYIFVTCCNCQVMNCVLIEFILPFQFTQESLTSTPHMERTLRSSLSFDSSFATLKSTGDFPAIATLDFGTGFFICKDFEQEHQLEAPTIKFRRISRVR